MNCPPLLQKIPGAPKELFYKGNWEPAIFEKCLAVVGSRHMTSYGKRAVQELVGPVARAGVTIVSGFMYGIDAASHQAALEAGGKTIAVMPCGIDLVHPEYQQELYDEILASEGLILSEYEGKFLPSNWTYPRRNRIIAGMSQATLVVEAAEKSGSLITANFAKKFKRKLFAVPGPLTSEVSKGTNRLLKEGATLVNSAKDILEFYGINFSPPGGSPAGGQFSISTLEGKILEQLRREPLEIDTLARMLEVPVSKLGTTLSFMELEGFLTHDGTKYYIK